jgi:hypothetical protein
MSGVGGVAVVTGVVLASLVAHHATVSFTPTDLRIGEASGMVVSAADPGVVWIANDSGNPAELFAVSTLSGDTTATVDVTGATNVDWEALAITDDASGSTLWIGDIGDNTESRDHISIYELAEPSTTGAQTVPAQRYDLRYPDGAHDAETLLVDPSDHRVYVVTKGLLGGAVYQASAALRTTGANQLQRVGTAPLMVTDGGFRPDRSVVLRNYVSGYVRSGVTAPARRFPLPLQRQGETLAVMGDGATAWAGSEGVEQPVLLVDLPSLRRGSSTQQSPSPSPSSSTPVVPGRSGGSSGVRAFVALLLVGLAASGGLLELRRRGQPR